jgi:hypothetical protein
MTSEQRRQIIESNVFLIKYPEFDGSTDSTVLIKEMFEIFDLDWTAENIEKVWFIILCLEQETA